MARSDLKAADDSSHQSPANSDAFHASLGQYRERLRRMVAFRMDRRIRQRVDPSDIIQEAFIEAANRIADYKAEEVPLFVWLRFITYQKMLQVQQRHLGVVARDPRQELSFQTLPRDQTSVAIIAQLIDQNESPGVAAAKNELFDQLYDALGQLDAIDREVLALRHFEQLKNVEVATILDISAKASSKRYFRALARLRAFMRPFIQED